MTGSNADLFDVSDRLALVTGSSRGLGRALALTLARGGARLIVHGRDAAAVEQTRAEAEEVSGRPAQGVTFDVTDASAVESAVARLLSEVGTPDILVNNAGVQRRAPIHEFAVSDWDDIVAANLSGVFYVSRFVTPAMVDRGSGKVVNVASVQSRLARQTIAPYSATKGGVAQLTAGMAADLARHGIQVNALSPGYFATDMNRALVDDPEFTRWLTQRTPAARWGDVDELRGALLFLASDASSFVSGQNIFVDGGMTAVV
ncbi:gluconate 5-dehydrogenase [Microbacterium proteolyticum]|uniref:Gluconate 5-dehydrogenase n=1 Tax=Microbacterium proteolyticum TaxID=1572644 RepID=A0A7W5CJG7_9MICO|nr:gluconate 5-dehydrogenase [Microbacterium proteolyticum]